MKASEIKQQVSIERLFNHYGSQKTRNRLTCIFTERHHNGDADPSVTDRNERATCHSQGCLKGDDIFSIVGKKERLATFQEQRDWLIETFALNRSAEVRSKPIILRTEAWPDPMHPQAFKHKKSDGTWFWSRDKEGKRPGKGDLTPTLYYPTRVQAAEKVILGEGERDARTVQGLLERLGMAPHWTGTTTPNGAGDVKASYLEPLFGKKTVVCLGDNDKAGEGYRISCLRLLQGKVEQLLSLRIPGQVNDITEWVDVGGTAEQFKALLETAKTSIPEPPSKNGLHLTSLDDLLNEPEEAVEYLVENLLPSGGVSVIGGKPKAGKSTTVRNLAVSVASGEPFLGLPTTQGPVFYLAFEEKRGEVRRHFRDLGVDSNLPILIFCGQSPDALIDEMKASVADLQPALIILDTLAKAASRVRDFNDYASVTQALDPFLHIARESGAHLLFVHHAGKSDKSGGDGLLGSTAIFGTVDTCLMQKRSDQYRTIWAQCRYGQDLEETVLEWDQDRRAISLGGSKWEAEVARLKAGIKDFLGKQDAPVSQKAIEEGTEGKTTYQRQALRELVTAEEVERSGKGRRNDPYLYALSCSLVPTIYREQENMKPENGQNLHEYRPESCSRGNRLFGEPLNSREQENQGRVGVQTPGSVSCGTIPQPKVVEIDD